MFVGHHNKELTYLLTYFYRTNGDRLGPQQIEPEGTLFKRYLRVTAWTSPPALERSAHCSPAQRARRTNAFTAASNDKMCKVNPDCYTCATTIGDAVLCQLTLNTCYYYCIDFVISDTSHKFSWNIQSKPLQYVIL